MRPVTCSNLLTIVKFLVLYYSGVLVIAVNRFQRFDIYITGILLVTYHKIIVRACLSCSIYNVLYPRAAVLDASSVCGNAADTNQRTYGISR